MASKFRADRSRKEQQEEATVTTTNVPLDSLETSMAVKVAAPPVAGRGQFSWVEAIVASAIGVSAPDVFQVGAPPYNEVLPEINTVVPHV